MPSVPDASVRRRGNGNETRSGEGKDAPQSASQSCDVSSRSPSVSASPAAAGHILFRVARQCFWLMVYAIIAMATPMVLNHAALSKEQQVLMPTPGSLVRINVYQKLFLRCLGHGTPVVILEAPMGKTHVVFEKLQVALAKHTRVCSYDRAGLGFSDRPFTNHTEPAKGEKARGIPHTIEHMVEDLYQLLVEESRLPTPFVFVATEMGAMVARFFAQIFDGSVAGVLLIDPLVEGVESMENGAVRQYWKERRLFPWQQQQLLAAAGWYRVGLLTGMASPKMEAKPLSELQLARSKHLLCKPSHWQSAVEEMFLLNETVAQIQLLWRIKSFPTNISAVVLTGDKHDSSASDAVNKAWQQSQQHLVTKLLPGCQHRQLAGAVGSKLLQHRHKLVYESAVKLLDDIKQREVSASGEKVEESVGASPKSSSEVPSFLPPSPGPSISL